MKCSDIKQAGFQKQTTVKKIVIATFKTDDLLKLNL